MLGLRLECLNWILRSSVKGAATIVPRCDEILRQFQLSAGCPADWPDDWRLLGALLFRRESTICRLVSPRSRRSICIKIVKEDLAETKDATVLYAALRHYHARSDRERGYTVPEPYGCIPEHGAVIMEWVEGRTFSAAFKRDLFSRNRRHENLRQVAGWLRWFHAQSAVEHVKPAKGRRLKGILKVFDQTRDLDKAATVHDPLLKEYIDLASRSSVVLRGSEIDHAILHDDFKPTNLIIARSGEFVGIDFLGVRRGPVSHDICRFLSDLDFYRILLGRPLALHAASDTNDFDAFLSAYGGRAGGISRPAFVYLYFVTILSALVHQRRKFRLAPGHLIRLAVLRRMARQLSHELTGPDPGGTAKPVPAFAFSRPRFPVEWAVAFWQTDVIISWL